MAEREGHPGEWELETMASAGPAAKAASPSTSDAAGGTEDGFAPYREALRNHFPSREEIIAEARAHTHRRRTALRTGGGSALAIVLAAALLWADPAWQREEIRTALGEQMRHTLADGSVLMLNTDTVLTIEKRLRTRSFILQQGEAGFTVAAGWRPFIVQTGDIRVRDIGTAFTVRRLSNGARVAVLEGVVEVSQPGHAGLTLREGQSVFTSDRGAAAEQGQSRLPISSTRSTPSPLAPGSKAGCSSMARRWPKSSRKSPATASSRSTSPILAPRSCGCPAPMTSRVSKPSSTPCHVCYPSPSAVLQTVA